MAKVKQMEPVRLVKQAYRTGHDGLLVAVIEMAMRDAAGRDAKPEQQADAVAYLNGRGGALFEHLDLLHWRLI
jgi:Flp pilus assembly CpaF family ATPase